MNIKEARQNLLNVLALGRIEMPVGSLTGQEHNALQESVVTLHAKAADAEELEKENIELKKALEETQIKPGACEG